jgi:hypothetical protein
MPTIEPAPLDRVVQRQRAVTLARHYREAEGLSIAQIAQRLGRAPATIKGYFYDPDGEKAKAVKRRYQGTCRNCGAPTQARNGKHDRYEYCKACHPGAIATRWTPTRVLDAMLDWHHRYGRLPSSYDWSRTHARRRGTQANERLDDGDWPAASVVGDVFGTWQAAHKASRPDT